VHCAIVVERRNSAACESQLETLVSSLAAPHRVILQHIIVHLRTVLNRVSTDRDDAISRISEVFQEILLRPPWDSIMYVGF